MYKPIKVKENTFSWNVFENIVKDISIYGFMVCAHLMLGK
jgi:hypothetical protein